MDCSGANEAKQTPLDQRRREFLETLSEVREIAAANGLTPEILEEILGEEQSAS